MSAYNLIPFANPGAGYRRHKADYDAAYFRVMESGRYILGPEGVAFEAEAAQAFGMFDAKACASGTDALVLALKALGIGHNDRVVIPALTAAANASAVVSVGAVPVFADVLPDTLCIDPDHAEALAKAESAAAIVAVHLYGNPAPMVRLRRVADSCGIPLIEDCAQAHGAICQGVKVGTYGNLATWSFYPTKNAGAFGDGGLVGTARPYREYMMLVEWLRQYGWTSPNDAGMPDGINSRLDELQAAFLRVSLSYLSWANHARRYIAERYRAAYAEFEPVAPAEGDVSAEHLFIIRPEASERDAMAARFKREGVETAVRYPVPLHRQTAFTSYASGPLPVAEEMARRVLALPIWPELTDAQVDQVCTALD